MVCSRSCRFQCACPPRCSPSMCSQRRSSTRSTLPVLFSRCSMKRVRSTLPQHSQGTTAQHCYLPPLRVWSCRPTAVCTAVARGAEALARGAARRAQVATAQAAIAGFQNPISMSKTSCTFKALEFNFDPVSIRLHVLAAITQCPKIKTQASFLT